jgi:hypothetical protein
MQKSGLRKTLLHEEALFDEFDARLEEARRILQGGNPAGRPTGFRSVSTRIVFRNWITLTRPRWR